MTPLFERIVSEKKWWIGTLALLLVLNVLAYFFVVRSLEAASTGADGRALAAADARRRAERELANVQGARSAQEKALEDLRTFYGNVLPDSLASARRMTYATLPAIADQSGVEYQRRRSDVAPLDDDSRLLRLTTVMELRGTYEDLRDFIHEVEQSPDFIVLDGVALTEINEGDPIGLVLTLSTYFPGSPDEP